MDRFFDSNNPLMRFLSRLVDLAVLNLLTLLCCVPVITAGASFSAMNYVLLKLFRRKETYVWKMFLQSFKANLRQGIPLGLIYIAYAAAVSADLFILHMMDSRAATWLMLFITFVSFIVLVSAVYTFALQARFENTIRGTLSNAWKLLVGYPGRSAGMLVVWVCWALILLVWHHIAGGIFLLYGFSLPGIVCAVIYDPIFMTMDAEAREHA
ncbi:MAG: YesL family protein [Solobacterium sp.]|nr:YesL family protein [Solobacterium sp.]